MSSRDRAWDELVRQVETELCERGPAGIDERKLRFLIAAYLRDIRNHMVRAQGVSAPAPRSAWDVAEGEDDGDTRPFAFVDELRMPKKSGSEPPDKGKSKKGKPEPGHK